ncbi:hypothetical protein WA026_011677 [Henosepilachna vigintioctopunctata]|uniref:Ig-like domain-containing protein n=1 Tax=Henosepilachna vigintioctopunctata TaxID=420089 RepID=A0AAW1UK36_9CUCU
MRSILLQCIIYISNTTEQNKRERCMDPPKVRVLLDPESATPAKEGDDVKLKCEGKARPKPHSYRWYQDVDKSHVKLHSSILKEHKGTVLEIGL